MEILKSVSGKGGLKSISDMRYWSFLEKYRFLQETSAASIPLDASYMTAHLDAKGCLSAINQYLFMKIKKKERDYLLFNQHLTHHVPSCFSSAVQ